MINQFVTLACALYGRFQNVLITLDSNFNRRKLITGLEGIRGTKRYPISISHSSINGNISISYGTSVLSSNLNCSNEGEIQIGRFNSINNAQMSAGDSRIIVGSFCSMIDVKFYTMAHNYHNFTTYYIKKHLLGNQRANEEYYKGNGIYVGNDVWIGSGTIVLGGVTIGDGAVIAAGSIVNRDVEPYAIYAGNPAKLVKYRFNDIIIERLIKSHWWDLDDETLRGIALEEPKNIDKLISIIQQT